MLTVTVKYGKIMNLPDNLKIQIISGPADHPNKLNSNPRSQEIKEMYFCKNGHHFDTLEAFNFLVANTQYRVFFYCV